MNDYQYTYNNSSNKVMWWPEGLTKEANESIIEDYDNLVVTQLQLFNDQPRANLP